MKTLKFASNLVPLVLSGEKVSTWRLFDDKNLQSGDELIFLEKDSGKEFAKALITSVTEKRLFDIMESDYHGHERFENKTEIYETYKKYYGDKVTSESIVKIIKFKLI